jgi:hypothetical protein
MEKQTEEQVVPMERQSFGKIFKDLPRRFIAGLWKLIGSRKFYVLALTVYLMKTKTIPEDAVGYVYLFIIVLVLFGMEGIKLIKEIKR